MKIKVLHVVGAMNRGGAEVMLMDLFRNVSEYFQFEFLVNYNKKSGIKEGDFDAEILSSGGFIHHIQAQWDIGPWNYLKEFKKIIHQSKPDIVHIHMNSKSGLIALAAKLSGVQHVITHSHANIKFRGSFLYKMISNIEMFFQKMLINRYSDQFWGCSIEANKSLFYFNKLNNNNSAIINNAIDVNAYQSVSDEEILKMKDSWGINPNTVVFGNVGRIVAHKNISFILDVLNEYSKYNTNFVFVVAGRIQDEKYFDRFIEKAKAYQLFDKVKYIGLRSDVPIVFRCFDIFLGPALKEGFGIVAVEAQAAGLHSILYTGFPKSVDMELGLVTFISNFSVENWVVAIQNINFKKQELIVIGNEIKTRGYDVKENAQKIESLYNHLVKS